MGTIIFKPTSATLIRLDSCFMLVNFRKAERIFTGHIYYPIPGFIA